MIVASLNLENHQSKVSDVFKDLQHNRNSCVFVSLFALITDFSSILVWLQKVLWCPQSYAALLPECILCVGSQLMPLLSLGQIQIMFCIVFQSFHQCSHPQRCTSTAERDHTQNPLTGSGFYVFSCIEYYPDLCISGATVIQIFQYGALFFNYRIVCHWLDLIEHQKCHCWLQLRAKLVLTGGCSNL